MGDTFYNPEKLYSKMYIKTVLKNAPRDIRHIGNNLQEIDCVDKDGKKNICVRIPEVIFTYIKGRY